MKSWKTAWVAVVVCLALGAPSFADHHDKGQGHAGHGHEGHGHGHGEAGMPPMGPPPEMKEIEIMNGKYAVTFYYKANPMVDEWTETKATAELSTVAGGGAQQMLFRGEMMGMPFRGIGLTTYDRETSKWQTTWVDSMGARLSMYTGDFKNGKIVMTGEDKGQGMTFHSRLTTYNITDKGFDWKYEMSMDGKNYLETAKATYVRR